CPAWAVKTSQAISRRRRAVCSGSASLRPIPPDISSIPRYSMSTNEPSRSGPSCWRGVRSFWLNRPVREQSDLSHYKFASNERPTLGVEIELNLVDSQTMALRSGVSQILQGLPAELENSVKPELFQCYVEINSKICEDVGEAEADLTRKIQL